MVEPAEYQPLSGNTRASANYQEYFLQSSILDSNCMKLIDRLQGLCDNVPKEPFTDHEKTYIIKNANNASAMVKACKALDTADVPWQMKYIGTTEAGDRAKGSLIRSCVTVSMSKEPSQFLEELGFKLQYELVAKGFFFRKGRIKIMIAKLHKLPSSQEPGKQLDTISGSHLVEVSIFAPVGQEKAGEEVRQFCEHLKPIITFDVDHRKIHQMQSA